MGGSGSGKPRDPEDWLGGIRKKFEIHFDNNVWICSSLNLYFLVGKNLRKDPDLDSINRDTKRVSVISRKFGGITELWKFSQENPHLHLHDGSFSVDCCNLSVEVHLFTDVS
jgi:hypothetical protein